MSGTSATVGWSGLAFRLAQVCNLHRFVHFSPLLRHVHSGSLHDLTHLQDSNCKTASGVGEPRIHCISSCPSSFVVHSWSLVLVQMAGFEETVSR